MQILPGDLGDSRIIALLHTHVTTARAETARGSAHALDVTALQSPDISFWAIWDRDELLGVGALRRLTPDHGEIKSMHTSQSARKRGAGSAMLRHLIDTARADGLSRVSLETGAWDYFIPARTFYKRHGFVECPPFGDYRADPHSVFMTLDLTDHSAHFPEPT
ncbi:GNAT family N-acetyltransferase [Dyella psychrodurans]|uniref:GNAT family N-acetyltransferase n=1 Tax=Dyella psychrodurans TaxID=1927960 RepID=A0A370XDH7_9GAMM|nr:GNAT family N-acetyltransferase [Dyella psychrodurans]RDS86320.1 GNAT family N-acetyltransferase [Dyella psychrodurans]